MLALMLSILLIGCSDSKTTGKEEIIQEDLLNYLHTSWGEFEERQDEISEVFNSVTGGNHTDDWTTYHVIQDEIIADYLSLLVDLESVKTETREVRDLNEMLIHAHNTQYNAMLKILAALQAGDYNLIVEANQLLDEARKGFRDFDFEIERLLQTHDIQLENEEG